jgi:DNA-binding transcriptional LysR family regulator
MRNVTLRQFRYFIAVAESNSVASAARMVNIAQSAITKSIQELEDEIGVRLFDRTAKGMQLTPDGHRFLVKARKVQSAVVDATSLIQGGTKTLEGELNIGVSSLVAGYYLSELVARFRRSCPAVKLRLVEEKPEFLEHLLINGEVDVAIMLSSMLADRQALVSETLLRSPNQVWMAANHPLAELEEISLSQSAEHEHILLDADRISDQINTVWQRYRLKPTVLMSTTSLEALRSLVGQGAGIAVLPDFLYRPWTLESEHVDVRPLRDAVGTVDVGLVWRRGTVISAEAQEFISETRDYTRRH